MEIETIGMYTPGPKANGGGGSGYVVRDNGSSMLVDCGPGVVSTLQQRGLTEGLKSVYITHWHADHSYDILTLAYVLIPGFMQNPERKKLTLHVPPKGATFLKTIAAPWAVPGISAFADPFGFVFDIREYANDEQFEDGGFKLETFPMKHAAPTCGVKISGRSGRVAFSGDTGWCDNLVSLADDVGVFVCEATLPVPDTSGHGHLCATEAGRAAAESRPGRLLLTHFYNDSDEWIEQQRAAALREFANVEVARPGFVLSVER